MLDFLKIDASKRILGLDYLRGIASILVVIAHTINILAPTSFLGKYHKFLNSYLIGFLIDTFFILSGFLIGKMLIKQIERKSTFKASDMKVFWIRRWFRTIPNYFLFLILYIVIFALTSGKLDFSVIWKYFFFLQNVTNEVPVFYAISWSLTIEEWFYILLPISLFLAFKLPFNATPAKKIIVAILTFLLVVLILRCYYIFTFDTHFGALRSITVVRLDAILYGVLAAATYIYKPKMWDKFKSQSLFLGLILFSVSIFLFHHYIIKGYFGMFEVIEFQKSPDWYRFLMYCIFPLSFALMLPWFNSIRATKLNFLQKAITAISVISYSLYLLHPIIIRAVRTLIPYKENILYGITAFALIWMLSLALSALNYRYFELPFTSLRERFSTKS